MPLIDLLIVLALIVVNGIFAMSEIAVVSVNKVRLQQDAEDGDDAASRALELANHPNRFLSTVQIGITLVGVGAGAFGGATLARPLGDVLLGVPFLEAIAAPLSFAVVVGGITYLSLVVGELVPKRIGLNDPNGIAKRIAGAMHALSWVATPIVRFLSASTDAVLWILPIEPAEEPGVSEEEINVMVEQGRRAGIIEPQEQEIIENAFWLGERRVRSIMTPRPAMATVDVTEGPDGLADMIEARPFSRYPLTRGDVDEVVGVLHVRSAVVPALRGDPVDLEALAHDALFVPESLPVFSLVERFREADVHLAVVLDEFGGVDGLVTMTDVVEELIGEIANQEPNDDPGVRPIAEVGEIPAWVHAPRDGTLVADGRLAVEELLEVLGLRDEVVPEPRRFATVGGLVTARMARLPEAGDRFDLEGWTVTVIDTVGMRVGRVLLEPDAASTAGGEADDMDDAGAASN